MELHGGNIYDKLITLDFSISVNPLGLPERVRKEAIRGVEMSEHYPDIYYTALRKSITDLYHMEAGQVALGNGATELIYALVHVRKPKTALIIGPTFSEYELALKSMDCTPDYYYAKEEDEFIVKTDVLELLESGSYDMLFACNPNNPTGRMIKKGLLTEIIECCERKGILFMLDECFMDFVKKEEEHSYLQRFQSYPHFVVLRAFTKIFAMPGLRLGYAISADAELMGKVRKIMPPWNVSVPAQYAGVAALKEQAYVKETKLFISSEKSWMADQLERLGLKVFPSKANFILFQGPVGLQEICLENQILIRDASSFGGIGEGYFRIGIKKRRYNEQLLKVLKQYKNGDGTWRI